MVSLANVQRIIDGSEPQVSWQNIHNDQFVNWAPRICSIYIYMDILYYDVIYSTIWASFHTFAVFFSVHFPSDLFPLHFWRFHVQYWSILHIIITVHNVWDTVYSGMMFVNIISYSAWSTVWDLVGIFSSPGGCGIFTIHWFVFERSRSIGCQFPETLSNPIIRVLQIFAKKWAPRMDLQIFCKLHYSSMCLLSLYYILYIPLIISIMHTKFD